MFLDDQVALLDLWQRYLSSQLDRPVTFVQRGSYREIVDLLLSDGAEVAWLCGYPYVLYARRLHLVAVPRYQGAPLYRSYLIVPAADSGTQRVEQLAGRIFAYSDPLSNSGYLVPRTELLRAGHAPERFFRRSFFTFGHRKVVQAVQAGLADAGAVDGYVWDTLAQQQPHLTAGVRVAWRSATFGFPPVVASGRLSSELRNELARALAAMPASPLGAHLIERLNIDGFATADPAIFDGIRARVRMAQRAAA